jgi:hypothetical protein
VLVDVGWKGRPAIGIVRAGTFEPAESGGEARSCRRRRARGLLDPGDDARAGHEEQAGPSIEDAEVIVAGGRGLGGPENFALVEGLAKALGGAVAATRRGRRRRWYPYSAQVGQTGQERLAEALRRLWHLGRDPAQGGHAGLERDRRDQQGRQRADLSSSATSASSATCTRCCPKLTELIRARKAG